MLPGFGEEAQRRLSTASVVVLGAGGLGTVVVPALAAAGVGSITVIDDDSVEISNLHRQLTHGIADIGRRKVDSLADTVKANSPDCQVVGLAERISAESLPGWLAGADLLVDGTDNFPTRYTANDAAESAGLPLVWGAILRYHGQVGVAWRKHGPTYRDLFPAAPAGDELSCELGGVLPTLCTVIGGFMAAEVIKLITGIGDPLVGRVLTYDALTARIREIDYGPVDETVDSAIKDGTAQMPGTTQMQVAGTTAGAPPTAISAAELLRMMRAGDAMRLVDVREPHETSVRRIAEAQLIPLAKLQSGSACIAGSGKLVIYCESDPRSRRAVLALADRGEDAVYLAGGIRAFAAIGGDLEL